MRLSVRRALAATTIGGIALTALAVPTAAMAADTQITLDCMNLPAGSDDNLFRVPTGSTITYTLANCDTLEWDEGANAPSTVTPGPTVVAHPGDEFYIWNSNEPDGDYYYAELEELAPEVRPTGVRLATHDFELPVGAPQIALSETTDGEHLLGGVATCGLEADPSADHVYAELPVTITAEGDYTFRGTHSTPSGSYLWTAGSTLGSYTYPDYDPLEDPFLALYSTWDPTSPDTGVVGCNDDLNDILGEHDWESTDEGLVIEGHQPRVGMHLTPGQYTLVLMTWEALGTADLAAGTSPGGSTFPVGSRSTSFELWGPTGGLYLGHGAAPVAPVAEPAAQSGGAPVAVTPAAALAETGSDATPVITVGAILLILGGVLVGTALRRRRRTRA